MTEKRIETITGGIARDHRGEIRFVNDFDMTEVERFYIIKNSDIGVIRGWRAHRLEQRWFYVLSGTFAVDLVKIDDWKSASRDLPVEKRILKMGEQKVLHVPTGYGTAFQALEADSELLVFADCGIEHAANDDYTWPTNFFINREPYHQSG
ncbi:MAG: WxcM-like domain-containing protein [Sphingobacterium sp.]